MWNAIKRKFRFCCPTLISSPQPNPLTPGTSCCSSGFYYYDYHSASSRPIQRGYALSDDDVDIKKQRRGFVRFSGKMKTKLTERAVRELDMYGSGGTHRIVSDPVDLNAIHPWLSGVRPMDANMRKEMEYLVETYDREYEDIEKTAVVKIRPGDDDNMSVTPSITSNASKRSAYHSDRLDFATRIRYAKEAAMKEKVSKLDKKEKNKSSKSKLGYVVNKNLAVKVYSMPLQPPEYKRYNKKEGFTSLRENYRRNSSSSSSSSLSSSSSSSSSSKRRKKKKKKQKSKGKKSRKRKSSSSSGKSDKNQKKNKDKKVDKKKETYKISSEKGNEKTKKGNEEDNLPAGGNPEEAQREEP